MKKVTPLFTLLILIGTGLYNSDNAQNVGINTTGAIPSANAILDLNTGNKYNLGLIIPHVTLGASLAAFSPPMANAVSPLDTGMMVYNMNGPQPAGYYCWNGSQWVSVSSVSAVSGANNGLTVVGANTQLGGPNPLLANTTVISGGNNLAFTGTGKFQLGASTASTGTLQFFNIGSANAIGISAGPTTSSYNLILPTAQAAFAGQVLTNNGAGVLSWTTPITTVTANAPAYITGTPTNPVVNVQGDLSGTDKGGVLYSTTPGSAAVFTPTGTAGYLLQSNGVNPPTWINPNLLISANSGLTMTGNTVSLGGVNPLLGNTSIISGGNNLAFTGTGKFQLGAPGSSTGTLEFYSVLSGSGVGISAGATTASYNLTLPTAQATSPGDVLVNNGAGALSWSQVSAIFNGTLSNVTVLTTSSTTFTTKASTTSIIVKMIGGGGGGGSSNNNNSGGSGGGAGGYCEFTISGLSGPTTIPFVVGAGGAGGAAGGSNPGASGGTTSFNGGMYQALGGQGGIPGALPVGMSIGGPGGTASGGYLNIQGNPGGLGYAANIGIHGAGLPGIGGNGILGGTGQPMGAYIPSGQ